MKNILLIIFFFPLIFFGQRCDTIFPLQHADTVIYCITDATCHYTCDGSIEVTVRGSNQPYSFSWGIGSAFIAGDNYRDTLCANQYIISIIDNNGNLVNNTYVNDLFSPPNWTYFEDSIMNPSCFNYDDGKIYLSIGGATPPYTYSWDDGTNTEDRVSLDSGLYILNTIDSNNCVRIDSISLTDPIEVNSSTIANPLSCIGLCDGSGIVTPSDGIAPYTYTWSNGDIDSIATGLCYGIDTVYIEDANGCLDTNFVDITNPDTLKLSNITIDDACYQVCDGQLSVSIEGGQSPYTTEWSLAGIVFNTSDTITNNDLCPSEYKLVFTDDNSCSDSIFILLAERDSFIVAPSIIDDSCFNSCKGQIQVEILNQDNPPFNYYWNQAQGDSVLSNCCSDSFALVIIDDRLCTDTFEFFVGQGDSMYFDSLAIINNTCYGDENGAISIFNFNGGILPLTYSWSDGQITTAAGINTLSSGLYSVNIEDAYGCILDSANILVDEPDSLYAISSRDSVSCFGVADGVIDVDIFGGSDFGNYFISWDIVIPDTNYIDSLSAGEYIYTIVDTGTSCPPLIDTLLIVSPDSLMIIDSLIVHVLCHGDSTGQIQLTVNGGTAPYQYSINNGLTYQSQNYFDSLSAGSYSLFIKDANDCLIYSPVYDITEPLTALNAGVTLPNLLCFGDTGSIILNVNGGVTPYLFNWTNGSISQNLNGISAGNYQITILDSNSCELIIDTVVIQPSDFQITYTKKDIDCNGNNNGEIDLAVTGGLSPYSYTWTGPGGPYTTEDLTGLNSGVYVVIVIDANNAPGCEKTESITLIEPLLLTSSISSVNLDCFQDYSGSISLTLSGGTSPYNYDWSGPSGYTNNIEDLQNISAGNYTVIVTDFNNCLISDSDIITEPSDIFYSVDSIDLVCNNEPNGQIIFNASGGTPGYSFSIDGAVSYQVGNNFINLDAGNYSVWIKDAKGCEKNQIVVLDQPTGYSTIVNIVDVVNCNGDETGSIDFALNGNTPPYSYSWSNNQSSSSINNLSAGNYDVTVSDANNCEMIYYYLVNEPEPMVLVYNVQPASCEEKNDGSINTVVTGGAFPISFQWGTGETSASIFNLSKGIYSLYVEDAKGCFLPTEIIELGFDGFNGCVEIPSGFTPNNDNIHDEWVIYGLNDFPDVVVKVYNRWGQEVFSSSGYTNPWDGKYNGVDLPTAAYYYVIELNESGKVFNGTITIKR
jgi:gliding motility-associated-like protein